jgi:hypothetical protein
MYKGLFYAALLELDKNVGGLNIVLRIEPLGAPDAELCRSVTLPLEPALYNPLVAFLSVLARCHSVWSNKSTDFAFHLDLEGTDWKCTLSRAVCEDCWHCALEEADSAALAPLYLCLIYKDEKNP